MTSPLVSLQRRMSSKRNPVPVNPLSLVHHPLYSEIKSCAGIIDTCWPALLATCSTFLHAALDSDYYHGLVRAIQKFAHVAGLLRLSTPRDAFLTTLGKAAVPANLLTTNLGVTSVPGLTDTSSIFHNPKALLSVDSFKSQISTNSERARQLSADASASTLNIRNLLCLRALLNLGIALGPTLNDAWVIILETLQQADFVMFSSTRTAGRAGTPPTSQKSDSLASTDTSALLANLSTEIKAVELAASRLFESTLEFPNESFLDVVTALCKLFESGDPSLYNEQPTNLGAGPASPRTPRTPSRTHRRIPSINSLPVAQNQQDHFALAKLGEVASINIDRLANCEPMFSGWDIIMSALTSVACSTIARSPIRLRASEILVRLVGEVATISSSQGDEERTAVQNRAFLALRSAIQPLCEVSRDVTATSHPTDIDIHKVVLQGLKDILEQCGETIISGWEIAFEVIGSVFTHDSQDSDSHMQYSDKGRSAPRPVPSTRSTKLTRSSFASLQLICSDFLPSLPSSCFLILVDTLYDFCTQDDDLNICLTVSMFFLP